ncbi:MAG: PaaI family thioesterase [Candidatus Omnitrophica bacterium]|nr:PaaI family thioesterase [Candidatus Omnitrophota bacterium]
MQKSDFHLKASPFTRHVGIETLESGRTCRLKVGPRHANAMGYAHGGAIFTLADRAFSCAVNRRGAGAVAMEMKINFLLPVRTGDVLTTRVKTVKQGRSTAVCYVEVRRKKDLVAVVLATGFQRGAVKSA